MPPFRFRRKPRPEYDEREFMPPERREAPSLRERARRALELPAVQAVAEERSLLEDLIRPLILAGMNVCLVTSLIDLIRAIEPSFPGLFLQLGVFLVSLEGLFSARLMRRIELHTHEDQLKFRGGEVVVLLLLLKLLSYIPRGLGALPADIPTWRANFFGSFFEPWYVTSAVLALIFWWLSLMMARDFWALRLHREEFAPSALSREYDMWVGSPSRYADRTGALRRISGRFFWGGLVLLILSGLARIQIEEFFSLARTAVSGLVINVLIYFMLGLALISQGQFQVQLANWKLQRIQVSPKVASQWFTAAVAMLVVATLVALLLPTDYSVGLLDTLRVVLFVLVQLVMFILSLPLLLLSLLLSLLFRREAPAGGETEGLMRLPLLLRQEQGRGWRMPPLVQSLRALLFWAILLGIFAYSLYSFLHYRSGLFRRLVAKGPFGRLKMALAGLWRRIRGMARRVGEGLAARRAARGLPLGRRLAQRLPFLSLSSLSPGELVQYFYLSILRRAAQAGRPRPRHETPYEYTASLGPHLPDTQRELGELTDAFVEARYGRRAFTPERANLLKRSWQRVRQALRLLRKGKEGDGSV